MPTSGCNGSRTGAIRDDWYLSRVPGLQASQCDSGRPCPSHQSLSLRNASSRSPRHLVHTASGTPCPLQKPISSKSDGWQKGQSSTSCLGHGPAAWAAMAFPAMCSHWSRTPGLQISHCDSGRLCPLHQSFSVRNISSRSPRHLAQRASGTGPSTLKIGAR